MAITFERKTEEELQKEQREAHLIPKDTIVDFVIKREVSFGAKTYSTEERESSTGKPQLLLVVELLDNDGAPISTILDYITMGNSFATFKINRLAELVGIEGSQISANDLIDLMGKCKVGISKSNDPQYADKNNIAEYLKADAFVGSKAKDVDLDDEIPL